MSHSVLVAEDDPGIRHVIRRALENAGYEVREAVDGNEAVRLLGAAPFDAAVVDIFMPEKDGIETIMFIRKTVPGVKVVAITGAAEPLFLDSAAKLGAARVLAKPFRPQALVGLIDELLAATPAS